MPWWQWSQACVGLLGTSRASPAQCANGSPQRYHALHVPCACGVYWVKIIATVGRRERARAQGPAQFCVISPPTGMSSSTKELPRLRWRSNPAPPPSCSRLKFPSMTQRNRVLVGRVMNMSLTTDEARYWAVLGTRKRSIDRSACAVRCEGRCPQTLYRDRTRADRANRTYGSLISILGTTLSPNISMPSRKSSKESMTPVRPGVQPISRSRRATVS
jgi:hypothetical protein